MIYISVYGRLYNTVQCNKKAPHTGKGAKSLSITYSIRKGYCSNFNRYIALLFDESKYTRYSQRKQQK